MLLEKLAEEAIAGRVRKFAHPSLPLIGYNYTETCQFEKEWNDTNLQCRGLILTSTGTVVARPFKKFFNYEELSEKQRTFNPSEIEQITTKEDGSLIIAFFYDNAWRFSTRGSFISPQAQLAELLWIENPLFDKYADKTCTYLFELVGPENINVCRQYKTTQLILLGIIRTRSGEEATQAVITYYADRFNILSAMSLVWGEELFKQIKANNDPNFEGIVVKLKSGLRFKLKSTLYCQLHRVITGEWTTKRVLDIWMSKQEGNFILDPTIPDEFYTELTEKLTEIDTRYELFLQEQKQIVIKARMQMIACRMLENTDDRSLRKLLATIMPETRSYLSAIFSNDIYSDFTPFQSIAYELFCKQELR